MTNHTQDDRRDEWLGSIVRSQIDQRVWVAVVPETDVMDGAMAASTSLRACKAHVERQYDDWTVEWVRDADGSWSCYPKEDDCG
jgi:hypothetical protein